MITASKVEKFLSVVKVKSGNANSFG